MVDTLFYAINRSKVAEALGSIPAAERPTVDTLIGYLPRHKQPDEIAWTELFPEACYWLNDRDQKRAEDSGQLRPHGQYDYVRNE